MANETVTRWVEETARLTKPQRIEWLDGSDEESARLLADGVQRGVFLPLDPTKHPNSYLYRSHPSDVARTEHCTYLCTPTKDEAGPTNNWMAPDAARSMLDRLFEGAMRGRTMYVVPYLMGPPGSAFSKVGVELTDSLYVAASMRIMTRMGTLALEHLGTSEDFVAGLHSLGTLNPDQRAICHFPQTRTIYSINSGYGGNALLGKKCFALRIASSLGAREGWLAEHMLIMGVEDSEGRVTYLAGAFPSACGKTNLAMLQPTGRYAGWKIWCVGDDIAWLRVGPDGRLYATNPEAGFFGVAPGTNWRSNPNMMRAIDRNALFTNVARAPDGTVWWEGLEPPAHFQGFEDWRGRPWDPASGEKAAHPNSRFTVPISQCPVVPPTWDDPNGVPISGILFGARRATVIPLVFEAFNWRHGVYLGATLTSETTAASTGATGTLRHDPMAMLPFCGYHMADYFSHWLRMGERLTRPPRIFRVNWFRRDAQGRYLWPGFSENMRVLKWMVDRCAGRVEATETPIGYLPQPGSVDLEGLGLSAEDARTLLTIDKEGWLAETTSQEAFFEQFGARLPRALMEEHHRLVRRL